MGYIRTCNIEPIYRTILLWTKPLALSWMSRKMFQDLVWELVQTSDCNPTIACPGDFSMQRKTMPAALPLGEESHLLFLGGLTFTIDNIDSLPSQC